MPIYEYECSDCKRVEEAVQRITDPPLATCSHCSGPLRKLISQSAFHLKGTGWYVTDYADGARKGSAPPTEGKETPASKAESS